MYWPTRGASVRAVRPEIPAPSSRTIDLEDRQLVVNSGFLSFDSHSASMGVTFQSTAPVVPPDRFELRRAGDCWISMSRPLIGIVNSLAFESTNPRLEDGIELEKRRNDSYLVSQPCTVFRAHIKCSPWSGSSMGGPSNSRSASNPILYLLC